MSVQLYDASGLVAATSEQTMQVVPGTLSVTTLPLAIDELNAGGMVEVAQFSDTDPAAVSSEYTALTSLANSDCQVLPDANGGFDVYASLSSAYSGSSSAITVTIDKTEASTLVATDTKTFSSIVLDGGATDTLASLPTDVDLNVNNWTTLDLERNSVSLNTVAVTDGSIVDGSVSAAESFTLDNATISANLSGGNLTASDLVSLSGTGSLTGTVTVNGELDVAGLPRRTYYQLVNNAA